MTCTEEQMRQMAEQLTALRIEWKKLTTTVREHTTPEALMRIPTVAGLVAHYQKLREQAHEAAMQADIDTIFPVPDNAFRLWREEMQRRREAAHPLARCGAGAADNEIHGTCVRNPAHDLPHVDVNGVTWNDQGGVFLPGTVEFELSQDFGPKDVPGWSFPSPGASAQPHATMNKTDELGEQVRGLAQTQGAMIDKLSKKILKLERKIAKLKDAATIARHADTKAAIQDAGLVPEVDSRWTYRPGQIHHQDLVRVTETVWDYPPHLQRLGEAPRTREWIVLWKSLSDHANGRSTLRTWMRSYVLAEDETETPSTDADHTD